MVLTSNGYWCCNCKSNYEKRDSPKMLMLYCPLCKIQNKYCEDRLKRIKYSCAKLLVFHNELFTDIEIAKRKDPLSSEVFSIEYQYKFKDFSTGYSSSIYLKDCKIYS